MLSINPVLPGIQGDCKMTAERMTEGKTDIKWKQGCQAFLQLLVNSWVQVMCQYFSAKTV
jgi:hypothetical protein